MLPVQNEAPNIFPMVEDTLDALSDVVPEYELLIVDDGSTDATTRLADELARQHPQVRVVPHRGHQGYGSAWRSGIAAATKQYTVFIDADRQYNPTDLTQLVQWNDRYDLVAGYRQRRSDPLPRRLLGWGFTRLVRLLFAVRTRDATCGFLLARTSLLKRLPLESRSALIRTEVLYRSQELRAEVREASVRHYPRRAGKAKGARPLALLLVCREVVALRRRIAKERQASIWSSPAKEETLKGGEGTDPQQTHDAMERNGPSEAPPATG